MNETMGYRRFMLALAVAALLAVTACGGRPEARAGGASPTGSPQATTSSGPTARPGPPTSTPAPTASPHQGEGEGQGEDDHGHDGSVGRKYSPAEPPSEGFRRADTGESTSGSGRVPLELRIVPGCAEAGKLVQVTARTKPDVQIALMTNVHGSHGKPQEIHGRSDEKGLFSWAISLPASLRSGTYDLFGAVADTHGPDGGRSGAWLYVVAAPGGCR